MISVFILHKWALSARGATVKQDPSVTAYSVPLLLFGKVSSFTWWRSGPQSYLCINKRIYKVVLLGASGSVSNVVAQEDDVVCDDGGGLTSDLVLVHIFSVIQFPLH